MKHHLRRRGAVLTVAAAASLLAALSVPIAADNGLKLTVPQGFLFGAVWATGIFLLNRA